MAKKQKSKLLAMALCASVMTGIYASPVFAGDVVEESITGNNSGLSFTIDKNMDPDGSDAGGIYFSGSNGVSGQIYGHLKIGGEKIAGALIGQSLNLESMSISTVDGDETITETITVENIKNWNNAVKANENVAGIERIGTGVAGNGKTTIEGALSVDGTGVITHSSGEFNIDAVGNLRAKDVSTAKYSLNRVGYNTQKISFDGTNTVVDGKLVVDKFGNTNDSFWVTKDGAISAANDKFYVGTSGEVRAANGNFEIRNDGDVVLRDGATVDGVDVSEVAHNVDGIRRDDVRDGKGTTVIEDSLFVDGVSQRVYTRGDVYSSGDFVTVDENGEKYSLNNIGDKTAGISQHKWNTTYFTGAIASNGDIKAPEWNGFTIGTQKTVTSLTNGNLYLGDDEEGNKINLTKDQLANINATIGEGQVVNATQVNSTGDVVTVDEEGNIKYSLNTIGANTQHIIHDENGTHVEGYTFGSDGSFTSANNKFRVTDTGKMYVSEIVQNNGQFYITANGQASLSRDQVVVDYNGNITLDSKVAGGGNIYMQEGATVDGVDVSKLNSTVEGTTVDITDLQNKTQNMYAGKNYTTFKGSLSTEGSLSVGNGAVRIDGNYGKEAYMTLKDVDGNANTLTSTQLANINNVIQEDGNVVANSVNVGNGAVVANTDGSFSAANGAFTVEKDGTIYARQDDATFNFDGNNVSLSNGGNSLSITDNALTLSSGANSKLQLTQEGLNYNDGALTVAENGTLKIHGDRYITLNADTGVINAADFTTGKYGLNAIGDSLGELQEDFDTTNANVAGIERIGEGAPGEGITTIEDGALFVSKDVTYMNSGDAMVQTSTDSAYMSFGDNMISVNKGGINLVGSVGFTGHDGGRYTLSDLEGRVYDLEQKTEHITVDEAGNTTISSPNGDTTLTVTDEGVNIEGNGNVGGDATVSGNLDVEGTVTAPTGDFDKVTADEATVGNTHIGENGVETDKVTVTGADGSVTTIDGGTITTGTTNIKGDSVYSENGYFDNLNSANGGTIGGVKLEGNTVDADKVVTGNTTLDNEGLNVGGQTSVTADGVNVGGNGGTTVDKEGVSIADSTIISDHDVVINDDNPDERVSLADVGNRVGNLEQGLSDLNSRVDKLDDRIDKVGAMAAAIANLRTMGYDPAAPTEVAVGLGQYRDETGAALGLFHYPNRDFMLSLSVSTAGDEVMGGIGATWKFGRKSPEKVAEIKKAQAEADVRRAEAQKLAKAEELKAAAKEAKIKAQMERHAKLAAERAAEAEAK